MFQKKYTIILLKYIGMLSIYFMLPIYTNSYQYVTNINQYIGMLPSISTIKIRILKRFFIQLVKKFSRKLHFKLNVRCILDFFRYCFSSQ